MSDMDTAAKTNTSASWVAAMAASLEADNCDPAARLLRALLAERDVADEMTRAMTVDSQQRLAERDAALAEAARLREALEGVLEIEGWSEDHPRYIKARAALAKEASHG